MALTQVTGSLIANTTIDVPNLTAASQYMGFKNRVINGGMMIDQRNAGAAVTVNSANTVYTVDRFWASGQNSDGIFTVQKSATAPAGFANSVVATVTTIDNALGATQYYVLSQRIEGSNVTDLGWGSASAATVTLSFWVRSSVTGSFGGVIRNADGSRSYPFTYSINAANTWQQISLTIPGDTAGTWGAGTGIGIEIDWSFGTGSTYSGTAGSWSGNAYYSATGATNLMATLSATWYLTGVQLEKGSTATSFDYRPYGTELALCQRYYSKSYDIGVVPGTSGTYTQAVWSAGNTSSTGFYGTSKFLFPVVMRSAPTVSIWTYLGTASQWHAGVNGVSETAYAASTANISTAGFTVSMSGVNTSYNISYGTFAASAEL